MREQARTTRPAATRASARERLSSRPAAARASAHERLASHERPGTMLKGPPITVRCPCGERRELAYGEVWRCACGRRWDTAQVDAAQYARLRRVQLRFRILPVCLGLATSLAGLFFLLTHNTFSLFVLLPAVLVLWGMVLRPIHRRRYAAALGELPRWELRSG
ncbi:MAG: hypothetical protein QOG96_4361 [Pseudonocardiales bacterium]|nr:hypothetical protein [Pseudonocardiales bacterium]MDT7680413.1 hypothetical protein [Pseudonocardiales bacterium]MDT7750853.1 hypothetical protein [Pseudonocardiales bacterium]